MRREIKDCFLLIGMMIVCLSSAYAEQALPAPAQAPAITNAGHALLWGLKLDNKQELIEKRIKYTVKKGAYILKLKDDPKDRIEVEVGDIKQGKFCPQVKIKRWDDEVNLAVRLINDEKTPAVSTVGNKIIWQGQKVEAHFYEIQPNQEYPEGVYEFEVILKEKPISNKVEFSIQTKRLNFFYQPPLTQEYKTGWSDEFQREIVVSETEVKDKDGNVLIHRPENVVGSYAVYYKNCPPNIVGGKKYKTGKAFHIYRPRIEDVKGNWVWGELDIDEEGGFLTVTIPQDFLDKAVYPVRHAAGLTFGYDPGGTSGSTSYCNDVAITAQFATDASAGGTSAISQSWLIDSSGTNLKVALYSEASSKPSVPLATGTSGAIPSGNAWATVNFATPYTLAASTNYWFSCACSATALVEYDAVTRNSGRKDPTSYASFPVNPFGAFTSTWTDRAWYVYTTYTAAENDAGFLTMQ